jgi:glucose/mannose transport system substrate-binding protein
MMKWLALGLTVFVSMLTGCASNDDQDNASTSSGPSGELEIFSWWTAGGDQEALLALIDVFHEKYPDVEVYNSTVDGGSGTEAKIALAERLAANDPPGTFQVHAGQELIEPLVTSGKMVPLTDLFVDNAWSDAMPPNLIDILSYDGDIWAVPVNIHRANVLWYNKSIFAQVGLQPPTTWDEFFLVASTLKDAGITPLGMGGKSWLQMHLLETVLLGTLGADGYRGLWTGQTAWDSAEAKQALQNFDGALASATPDFKGTDNDGDEVIRQLMAGNSAMAILGDWAEGNFKASGWTPNDEFGWVPTPGSAGVFDALSDTFGLPKGAPNPDAVLAWLEVCGSKEGQDAFNPRKGSIPSRTDAEYSLYDEYQQSALDDFREHTIVPSLTHGAAAKPSWAAAIGSAVDQFVQDRAVDELQAALVMACVDAEIC